MPKAKRQEIHFRLDGIEPRMDIAWILAGPRGHAAFWREAARIGLSVKDRSIARGLGVDGEPLADITQYTRDHRHSAMGRARASAPPLTPARRLSRTRSYLRAHSDANGVEFYWRHDHRTGGTWGQILRYQAARGRDVIGFSDADRAEIARRMNHWWKVNRVRWATFGAVSRQQPLDPMTFLNPAPALPPTVARRPVAVDLSRSVLQNSSAAQINRAAAAGTFSGFATGVGRTTPRLVKR